VRDVFLAVEAAGHQTAWIGWDIAFLQQMWLDWLMTSDTIEKESLGWI
jgi:hypothetical protein